ncbi:hypothetical protein [Candidatus Nitrososphaera sp. FF02]|uniref:hypothetical protein n=1 Tax=Candidatus Nitrososphaera sp. FF02 TaxID=3398226 RepID=UPI0039EBB4E6
MINTVKVGLAFVTAAATLSGLGRAEKIGHDSCMEMIAAFESGESGTTLLCPADPTGRFFIVALPAGTAGAAVFVLGIKKQSPSRLQPADS